MLGELMFLGANHPELLVWVIGAIVAFYVLKAAYWLLRCVEMVVKLFKLVSEILEPLRKKKSNEKDGQGPPDRNRPSQ